MMRCDFCTATDATDYMARLGKETYCEACLFERKGMEHVGETVEGHPVYLCIERDRRIREAAQADVSAT